MRVWSTSAIEAGRPRSSSAASGCAPPMPPSPPVTTSFPRERAAEVALRRRGEGLVGALQDPLRADVDPRAGGHLAVHHLPGVLEVAEVSQFAHFGRPGSSSRSTRAARSWVRNTPTGGPTAPAASRPARAVAASRRSPGSSASRARPCRCRRRRSEFSGSSATSGSRLFINMRIAASAAHDLQVFSVPRGARCGPVGMWSKDPMVRLVLRFAMQVFVGGVRRRAAPPLAPRRARGRRRRSTRARLRCPVAGSGRS